MFSELLNGTSHVVSKSSAVHAADNPDKRQQHNTTHTSTTTDVADPPPLNIHSTHQTPTQVPTVIAPENIHQAETNTENAQFDDDEFINIFSTPVQDQGETSSRHVDSSNMHTFYQHHPSAQRGQKIILRTSHWKSFSSLEQDVSKKQMARFIVPTGIVDSDSEVEVVFDETANLRLSTSGKDGSDKGYSTNSLLEQKRDSYPDNDNYDPYDDDMYENHDMSEHLQFICDDLDIIVHGGKKK
ncbi:hypothetical protein Tco_0452693 [Tanacetum coccineum]